MSGESDPAVDIVESGTAAIGDAAARDGYRSDSIVGMLAGPLFRANSMPLDWSPPSQLTNHTDCLRSLASETSMPAAAISRLPSPTPCDWL